MMRYDIVHQINLCFFVYHFNKQNEHQLPLPETKQIHWNSMVGRWNFLMALPIFGDELHMSQPNIRCEGGREEICWGTTVERGTFFALTLWEAFGRLVWIFVYLASFSVFGYLFWICVYLFGSGITITSCVLVSNFNLFQTFFVFDSQYSKMIQTLLFNICWCMDADLSYLIWLVFEHLSQHPGWVSHPWMYVTIPYII